MDPLHGPPGHPDAVFLPPYHLPSYGTMEDSVDLILRERQRERERGLPIIDSLIDTESERERLPQKGALENMGMIACPCLQNYILFVSE